MAMGPAGGALPHACAFGVNEVELTLAAGTQLGGIVLSYDDNGKEALEVPQKLLGGA